jgi:hypothetical protein
VGILTSDFLKPVDRKLILVDHNELYQAVAGADEVEILEIIDHHRIGALRTQQPILFRNEPVGSTSTIVADCFFRHGVEMSPAIAGVLLSGLVSDTLNLTSPTTTARDAEVLALLQQKAGGRARVHGPALCVGLDPGFRPRPRPSPPTARNTQGDAGSRWRRSRNWASTTSGRERRR